MKKIMIAGTVVLGALFLAACNKVEVETEPQENKVTLTATISDDQTKTHLDGVYVKWSAGDALAVLSDTDWSITQFDIVSGINEKHAAFTGTEKAGTKFLALYPYALTTGGSGVRSVVTLPSSQTYVENGIASNLLPMYAKGTSLNEMEFEHLGSIIRIQLYSASPVSISTIELSGQGETIIGMGLRDVYFSTVDGTGDGGGSGEGARAVTLDCGAGVPLSTNSETPTVFNIVTIGGVPFSNGFNVVITTTTGAKMQLSKTGSFTFTRGMVHKFPATAFVENVADEDKQVKLDGAGSWETLATIAANPSAIPNSRVDVQTTNGKKLSAADMLLIRSIVDRTDNVDGVVLDLSASQYVSATLESMSGWKKISEIYLPSNITRLLDSAFSECSKLTNLHLHDGITQLGCYLIDYTHITSLYIPKTVTSMSHWLGYNCHHITEFDVDDDNPNFKDIDGVLFNKAGTELVEFPKKKTLTSTGGRYDIPDGVTTVKIYALMGKSFITHVKFPATMEACNSSMSSLVTTITCLGTTPFTFTGNELPTHGDLHVQKGYGSTYSGAWSWVGTKGWNVHDSTEL